ncbi:MAG: hypothetical protein JW880_04960 [Candidatus Thermoplasmatota archaeon]|nr:hypothetical protein [Candidatus Thermoplasmatota archaeon]
MVSAATKLPIHTYRVIAEEAKALGVTISERMRDILLDYVQWSDSSTGYPAQGRPGAPCNALQGDRGGEDRRDGQEGLGDEQEGVDG